MIEYEILKFPDKRLKNISKEVLRFDDNHSELINILISIMKESKGCVGISAPQINHFVRTVVVDLSNNKKAIKKSGLLIMNNPIILEKEGEIITREGCLSIPEFTGNVKRYERIVVLAKDRDGNEFKLETEGVESVVIQHEIDHLDGILFLDRLISPKDLFNRKNYL